MKKGEITAFLSLIFVLMISFVTAILESAFVQAEKNQARLDMDRAVYSVFGISEGIIGGVWNFCGGGKL